MRILPLVALLGACTSDHIEVTSSAAPIEAEGSGDFYGDVAYDDHERSNFDLLLPEGEGPFPVVLYIHGGGFTQGNKDNAWDYFADDAQASLDAGVAYGSIGYRLIEDGDSEGVIKCLRDSQHAVQYIRHYAEDLQIDPDRIAVYGGSAGAGTALWLASHDDLADKKADERYQRASSRIVAAGALETQASYDLVRWEDDVFPEYGITLDLAASIGLEQTILDFYGAESIDAIREDEALIAYRDDVDMLDLFDANDPPIWVENRNEPEETPLSVGALFHHPYHAREVHEAALDAGVEVTAVIPELEIGDDVDETVIDFLLREVTQ